LCQTPDQYQNYKTYDGKPALALALVIGPSRLIESFGAVNSVPSAIAFPDGSGGVWHSRFKIIERPPGYEEELLERSCSQLYPTESEAHRVFSSEGFERAAKL
jgi:hypothetical protein